jgi:hypothetical protein
MEWIEEAIIEYHLQFVHSNRASRSGPAVRVDHEARGKIMPVGYPTALNRPPLPLQE